MTNPKASYNSTRTQDGKDRTRVSSLLEHKEAVRATQAGLLIWMLSGTPAQLLFVGYQWWYFIGFLVQAVICWRQRFAPARATLLLCAMVAYIGWTFSAALVGLQDQFSGLMGQLVKLAIVLLPVIFLPGVRRGLIDAMAIICWIALLIFSLRQIILLAGLDIADMFQWFYSITGMPNDRTIIIFNFDIMEEVHRNSGPFREPGIFAANIVLAILLLISANAEYQAREVKHRIALFGVALVTTQSTMGLSVVPLIMVLSLKYYVSNAGMRMALTPVMAVLVALSIVIFGGSHLEKVKIQSNASSVQAGSWYNTRFGNAYIDYIAIGDRPLLGYGFSEEGRPNLFAKVGDSDELGLGNGLTGTIVKHGFLLSILLYALFLWGCIRLQEGVQDGIMAWLAFGILLFSQQLLLLPAAFVLLGSFRTPHASLQRSQRNPRAHLAAHAP